jgi:outer membrane murein-binding lipoprotein Lpp
MLRLRIVIIALLLFALAGCSKISQAEYDKVVIERDTLQADYDALKSERDILQSEKDKLQKDYQALNIDFQTYKNDTADWILLSETEKAAAQANSEAERLKAEEEQRKAEEAKAAEEAARKAEEEKKKAEEEAARIAEEKKGYETGITYSQLARTPDDYEGDKVKFKGQVLQVMEGSDEIQLRIGTKNSGYGSYYDDVIYVYYDPDIVESRILEDDIITIYGVSMGLFTYQSTMSGEVTVPLIRVDQIDQ